MIACSGCQATLPDWAQKCQFCGADVKGVSRPKIEGETRRKLGHTPTWVWFVYYGLAIYWLISGLSGIGTTVKDALTPREIMGMTYVPGFGFLQIISIAWSSFTALIAIGFALRMEAARAYANFFAFMKMFLGVCGVAGAFLGSMFAGPLGMVFVAFFTLDIISGALTIYAIGETERGAPRM